jgi:ribonuclease BN (tRNA processing enzyme)
MPKVMPTDVSLTLLGTGTPTPSLRRMCSGYLIRCGEDVILFDHGFGAHHRLLELGVRAVDVSHLFLTHLHYDHMGDVPRLLLTRWDQGAGKTDELKIYGPPPTRRVIAGMLDRNGVFGPDLVARTEDESSLNVYAARGGDGARRWPSPSVQEIAPGDCVEGGRWRVRVARAEHFAPHLNCCAFRFETDACAIVYSGDSGPAESVKQLAKECDVLIHMCHYMSGTAFSPEFAKSCCGHLELAALAAEAGVRTLVLTHITEQFDRPGLRERVISEMAQIFKGIIIFGEDGMAIPIKGSAEPHRLD